MDHTTITETMLFKDMLRREAKKAEKPSDPDEEEQFIEDGLGSGERDMIKKMVREYMASKLS
jgi:hypothetical protein